MTEYTVEDIIKLAISREEEAYQLYLGVSKVVNKTGVKTALTELAEEEKKHKNILQDVLNKEVPKFHPKKIQDLGVSDFLVPSKIDSDTNIQDVFVFAMKKEKIAAEFYQNLSDSTDDPELKDLFESFVNFEIAHKNRLEKLYEDEFYQEN